MDVSVWNKLDWLIDWLKGNSAGQAAKLVKIIPNTN